jgi:hypothetical protein
MSGNGRSLSPFTVRTSLPVPSPPLILPGMPT